jgi:6-pyruvoyltetrahydropterin/6-carboxytetrahydropterin synthase
VQVELTKEYRFEAAHSLPFVPASHKCSRVHGHSYKVEISVSGPVDPKTGWLIDFGVIDDAWHELFLRFDHHNLNEVPGLENSTCENIAGYVWRALAPGIPALSAITVWETYDSKCVYRGDRD